MGRLALARLEAARKTRRAARPTRLAPLRRSGRNRVAERTYFSDLLQCSMKEDYMETRLLIAYFLIGVLVAAALLLWRHLVIKRREHRRMMRGRFSHRTAQRRELDRSLTQP